MSWAFGALNLRTLAPLSRYSNDPLIPGSTRYRICPASSTRYFSGGTPSAFPSTGCQRKNTTHVNRSVATVIPEIGFEEEPISPVSRDDTVTNKNPNRTIMSAPTSLTSNSGIHEIDL